MDIRHIFEPALIILFLVSAVAYFIYKLGFGKTVKQAYKAALAERTGLKRKERKALKHNIIDHNANSWFKKAVYFFADLFWVLLIVVVVRSFLYEPFVIPSKSMVPGLIVDDIVLVDKSEYGIRLPVVETKITSGKSVERGDVVVFKFPPNPDVNYIKRVIGLPGDEIQYNGRTLIINGTQIPLESMGTDDEGYRLYKETIDGKSHTIRYSPNGALTGNKTSWVVPKDHYFVLGDNRDNSEDGRFWGFVPDENLLGRGAYIALNWGCLVGRGHCSRSFTSIK